MIKLKIIITTEGGEVLNEMTLLAPETCLSEIIFEHAITEVLTDIWEEDEPE
jgi:hypothetical protein